MDKHTGLAQEIIENELDIDIDKMSDKGIEALIGLLTQVLKDRKEMKGGD